MLRRSGWPACPNELGAGELLRRGLGAGLDLGGVEHRDKARGDAAAVADLVEGRVLTHLGERNLWQDCEVEKAEQQLRHGKTSSISQRDQPVGGRHDRLAAPYFNAGFR